MWQPSYLWMISSACVMNCSKTYKAGCRNIIDCHKEKSGQIGESVDAFSLFELWHVKELYKSRWIRCLQEGDESDETKSLCAWEERAKRVL